MVLSKVPLTRPACPIETARSPGPPSQPISPQYVVTTYRAFGLRLSSLLIPSRRLRVIAATLTLGRRPLGDVGDCRLGGSRSRLR
jgi:hypothetical protein